MPCDVWVLDSIRARRRRKRSAVVAASSPHLLDSRRLPETVLQSQDARRARNQLFLDLFAEDGRRNVYAGHVDSRSLSRDYLGASCDHVEAADGQVEALRAAAERPLGGRSSPPRISSAHAPRALRTGQSQRASRHRSRKFVAEPCEVLLDRACARQSGLDVWQNVFGSDMVHEV